MLYFRSSTIAGIEDDVVIQGEGLLVARLVEAVQNVVGETPERVEAGLRVMIPADVGVGVIAVVPRLVKPDHVAAVDVALHLLLYEVIGVRGDAQIWRAVRQRQQRQNGGRERRDARATE